MFSAGTPQPDTQRVLHVFVRCCAAGCAAGCSAPDVRVDASRPHIVNQNMLSPPGIRGPHAKDGEKVQLFLQPFLGQLQIIGIGIAQKFAGAGDFLVKPLRSILPAQHFAVRAVAEALMVAARRKKREKILSSCRLTWTVRLAARISWPMAEFVAQRVAE